MANITTIRSDKSFLSEDVRHCFMRQVEKKGHCHSDKRVRFFPKEVFCEDVNDEKTFFVPTIPLKKNAGKQKNPTPVWMCDFSYKQKVKIMRYAEKKGLKMNFRDFFKLPISKTSNEREEYIIEEICQN
ncbi:MAG TPA: hypothetical protein PKZ36_00700 [Candidatus Paceibacterota bacterium]|nr:hypothetical protein [Candidatus Paceibacterota bacterium]HPT17918.1 hypothetical protein [Candidatus Paceibacterota bacterium]